MNIQDLSDASLVEQYEAIRKAKADGDVQSSDWWPHAKKIERELIKRGIRFDPIQWKETVGS